MYNESAVFAIVIPPHSFGFICSLCDESVKTEAAFKQFYCKIENKMFVLSSSAAPPLYPIIGDIKIQAPLFTLKYTAGGLHEAQ